MRLSFKARIKSSTSSRLIKPGISTMEIAPLAAVTFIPADLRPSLKASKRFSRKFDKLFSSACRLVASGLPYTLCAAARRDVTADRDDALCDGRVGRLNDLKR